LSPLRLLFNVLWLLTDGLWMAAGWFAAAVIMVMIIIGRPGHVPHSTSPFTRCYHLGSGLSARQSLPSRYELPPGEPWFRTKKALFSLALLDRLPAYVRAQESARMGGARTARV
jgi:hypothetical protein